MKMRLDFCPIIWYNYINKTKGVYIMNKTLKILLAFMLIAASVLSFASCKGNNGDGASTTDGGDVTTASPETTAEVTTAETTAEVTTEDGTYLTLRIGSYNIANGRQVAHSMRIIAEDILAQNLDIVGIQEVDRFAKRSSYIDTMKLLSKFTGYEYYYYTKTINIDGDAAKYGQEGEYGTGILSKYPILESESTLLSSGKHEQRAYGYAKIDVNGTIINFFNTHLSYEDYATRTKQFTELAERLKDVPNCILTGDFNIDGFSNYVPLMDFMKLACKYAGHPVTFPSKGTTIDNILYSNEFKLGDVDSVKNNHSDHYLLWAELKLKIE